MNEDQAMNQVREEGAQAVERTKGSVRDLMGGAEALLRSTASYGGAEIEAARSRLRQQLEAARSHAGEWEEAAAQRYRHMRAATDDYVHANTWKAIGVAAVIGLLLGAALVAGSGRDHHR